MQGKSVWIISVPLQQGKDIFAEQQRVTKDDTEEVHKFVIPDLRVGNIDSLITLSDELRKLDAHVEGTLRKILAQYEELAELRQDPKNQLVVTKDVTPLMFITKFKWDEARFNSKRKSLTELAQIVETAVTKMDNEMRTKTMEYSSLEQKLNQVSLSGQGNLLTRDITKDIEPKKNRIVESKYLTTVFVVIPTNEEKEWLSSYASLNEFVVPESAVVVKAEADFTLYLVVVMKHAADDFKNACRAKRFIARKYDPSQTISDEDLIKLKSSHDKAQRNLLRWSITNFGEAFHMWVHLKCIQVFVESILRFGLPANFQAMLLIPRKNHESKLQRLLCQHYSYIGRDFGEDIEDENGEKFFPYVFSEAQLQ
eukprot:TRINITY_DN15338_c0_g1_i1.p1 TRINITY_DN15338_c0_g1~~TRINITY_DN15338_c0_g1_i1.p1  ORF type:complete len:368 (-),score=87.82 TRINITY_DN15338_c0_g1_i1:28-1131(-)